MPVEKNTTTSNVGSRTRQFLHEIDTWKRILEFIMEENSILKNRLAEVLNNTSTNADFINESEQYQNSFVQTDEYMWLVRKEIAAQEQLLLSLKDPENKIPDDIILKQKKLSIDMQSVAREFNKMKFDFNNYLGDVL